MMFSKFWSCFNETQDPDELNTIEMNHVFANCSEEDEIFPLTVKEIVEAQKADQILADWHKIGDYRQRQNDRSNTRINSKRVDYDYKVGDKVLIRKDGILHKAESIWRKEPWTITTIHTNGTIRIQCGTKSERINIQRVIPFSEELLT